LREAGPSALGADVGGTFTDIVLVAGGGSIHRLKVPSTPPEFGRAIVEAVPRLLDRAGLAPGALTDVIHGTTAATNAIVELRGARTALVTTKGFRDVLELGRLRRPSLFDARWTKPPPLVPRRLRLEVDERMDARGSALRSPDPAQVAQLAAELRRQGVESVAVCLLNSHANPAHEREVARVLAHECPVVSVSASCDVLPEIREYERTSTTTINAYVRPLMERYLASLRDDLRGLGVGATLRIMQSNGGLVDADIAAAKPVFAIESGPAAGVTAAAFVAGRLGIRDLFAFDMGGTTAKATLVEGGQAFEAAEYQLGGEMNTSRLVRSSGYTVRAASMDIAEVGAGGGSIFWIDQAGAARVGPESAGAVPGPVCYGLGGDRCTVTDANLVLGYLNPVELAGGAQAVDRERAVQAVDQQVARPLGAGLLEAAFGVHMLVNANMGKAIRGVSMERGRDPRDFVLMAFGGAGPMHAVALARAFHISRVIIPSSPGLFSAVGLLAADVRHDYVTSYTKGSRLDVELIGLLLARLEQRAAAEMDRADGVALERFLDVRYRGQSFELRIPLAPGPVTPETLVTARRRFDAEHERTYGHQVPEQDVEIVNLRLRASRTEAGRVRALVAGLEDRAAADGRSSSATRNAYFGPEHGFAATPVVTRHQLPSEPEPGPLLIEEMDATTVVPPGCRAWRDEHGNVVIDVE
jgi:N-methylhydantoinase A